MGSDAFDVPLCAARVKRYGRWYLYANEIAEWMIAVGFFSSPLADNAHSSPYLPDRKESLCTGDSQTFPGAAHGPTASFRSLPSGKPRPLGSDTCIGNIQVYSLIRNGSSRAGGDFLRRSWEMPIVLPLCGAHRYFAQKSRY